MIQKLEQRVIGTDYGCGGASFSEVIDKVNEVIDFINSLQQEQPEELLDSQQKYVDIVTERILKEGPIPTLKGKAKADFEKEFNRFKQISGLMSWPQYMEVYKRIILWFMAWGADRLPNLGKPVVSDEIDL